MRFRQKFIIINCSLFLNPRHLKLSVFLSNQSGTPYYALIRAIGVIGEASKKVPDDVKINFSFFPWKRNERDEK